MASAVQSHLSYFTLMLDGKPAPKAVTDDLLDCTVENSLNLADCCTIRMYDAEFHWLDSEAFQIGKKIEVFAGHENEAMLPIFYGEVTSLDLDLAADGVPTIEIICLDRSHRLQRGRQSRSFVQTTDSDIVNTIGQENGFQVVAESTPEVHDWLLQNNQSHWQFLTERAARNGFRLYVQGHNELHFKKVKNEGDKTIELTWAKNLYSFRPRVSASPQVDEVEVRGWDPDTKQKILGMRSRPSGVPQVGDAEPGGEVAKKAFGSARMVIVDRPVQTQRDAEDLAQSVCDEIAGRYLEADGRCHGQPGLKPGMVVEIKNIGKRFSGKYYVTSTTHLLTADANYTMLFSVSGKQPETLSALLDGGNLTRRTALGGNIVIGVVTDNNDKEGLGRVKVVYPWLTEQHTSYWARTTSQMAGHNRGMFNLPEINDEVLVAFEHGDITRPYVLGHLWNGKDPVPQAEGNKVLGSKSEVNRRGFHTRIGHQLNFDDTGGKGAINLKTAGGHDVTVDDANKKITITTTAGHNITLDDAGSKVIATTKAGHELVLDQAGAKIVISNPGGNMITSTDVGVIDIIATQTINMSAPSINISAASKLNMMGGTMTNVSSGVYLGLQGVVAVNMSGAAIKVNGGVIQVDGVKVDINAPG